MQREIEVLYFAGCPNYEGALAVVRELLAAEGLTLPVRLVRVETEDEARRVGFHGSPTIRVDGRDVAPPPAGSKPALACRVYRGANGSLSPAPPHDAILAALRAASAYNK